MIRRQAIRSLASSGLLLPGILSELLEIAMLESDDGAAAFGFHEPELHFGVDVGVVAPLGVDLPREEKTRRWLPCEHLPPLRLVAFRIPLEPAPDSPGYVARPWRW